MLNYSTFSKYKFRFQYEDIAEDLNKKELKFRTIERYKTHPDWKIAKTRKHKWITPQGTYWLNITMYYIVKNNKKKHFVYYHCDPEQIEFFKRKFEPSLINAYIDIYLNSQKMQMLSQFSPVSIQVVRYYINKLNVFENLMNQNKLLLENNIKLIKLKKESAINIEVDDTYTKIQHKQLKKKCCLRMFLVHQDVKTIKNNPSILVLKSKISNKETKNFDIKSLKNAIQNISSLLDYNMNNLTIFGDGARWMRTTKNCFNCKFILDKFHINRLINKTFNPWRGSTKETKDLFSSWKSPLENQTWYSVFKKLLTNKNYSEYMLVKDIFLKQFKHINCSESMKRTVNDFFRYIDNNRTGIWNLDGILINKKSRTEMCINYFLKENFKKMYSLFSLKTILLKLIWSNNQKGCAVVLV